ncbi:DUF6277 family protein [Serratia marcescens]|uniref:DUF6277 family protein n=1 Tax=Serratia marcescens TaxID=615 RepID=A0AAP8PXI0_SERMA|nr:DUF6277 family protein [Serratia marcescens]MBH3234690.1 hypothetical protein [Serratia marcescens]POP16983.1 hypothetical protein C3R40_09225 [Serratia marcescens]
MLDPAKILETMQAANQLGQNSQSSLSRPFMQGVSNIQMSGPDAAKSVMSNVTKSCDDMFGNMKDVFNGLQSDITAHQKMQTNAQPKDFNVSMNDLRKTVSKGFPGEMADFFSKVPKI